MSMRRRMTEAPRGARTKCGGEHHARVAADVEDEPVLDLDAGLKEVVGDQVPAPIGVAPAALRLNLSAASVPGR